MLVPDEIRELGRCLRLYQRRILTQGEVVCRLGAVARPHNLDAILADLPPELIEPLRSQTKAYRPVHAIGSWCPSGLPPSTKSFRRPSDIAFPDPDASSAWAAIRSIGTRSSTTCATAANTQDGEVSLTAALAAASAAP